MLIAKIENNVVTQVADYRDLFPEVSFPSTGVDLEWLTANSCLPVNVFKPYDSETQKLSSASPDIEGDWVYTVEVTSLTPEEITAKEDAKKAENKARAMSLLTATDWTQIPDVALLNKDEFTAYRAALRAIALNPEVTVEFPELPVEQWVTVEASSNTTVTPVFEAVVSAATADASVTA